MELPAMPAPTPHARRRLASIALGACIAAALPAAHAATMGSGQARSEGRSVGSFQAITLRGAIDLVVRQGASESVTVRGDDNLLPLVQTVVEGSGDARSLRIQIKPGESLRSKTPIVVTVDVVKLNALASAGSGDITLEALRMPALSLSISGSSNAKLQQLDTDRLRIDIAGSGDVQASGRAARLDIAIAGSGDVRTRDLDAAEVSVAIAGSGDASVTAQKSLSVSIAGSGDVDYTGAASQVSKSIVGSGTVRARQP
jgi:hypothetical protein